MIILVEGPDNTGKTTLCRRLIEKYGYEYIHLGKIQGEKELNDIYISLITKLKECKDFHRDIVIDRAYVSNAIYSKVFRDAPILKNSLYIEISNLVDKTIICLPTDKKRYIDKYNSEYLQRDDLYSDMSRIYDMYEEYFKEHLNTTVRYDWYEFKGDNIDKFIKENIKC